MKKRVVSVILMLLMLLQLSAVMSFSASAATSGKCGPNAYWSYSNGTLTIFGSGAVTLEGGENWFCDLDIRNVVVQKGIASLGEDLFVYVWNAISSVSLPEGLKEIGDHVFASQPYLKELYIPASVTKIGKHAFGKNCDPVMAMCEGFYEPFWPDGKTGYVQKGYSFKPVIYGKTGSAAEKYAKANGITFKELCDKFTDVAKTDWYHKSGAIHYAVDNGLFNGTSATTFSPEQNMTRAMFITVLGRLHGVKVSNNVTTKFTDVKKNQYYTGYVKWGSDNGIVAGLTKTKFGPNDNVTREQICTLMLRYCDYADIALQKVNAVITFKDGNKVSGYAKAAVKACQQGGLVNGEKVSGGYNFRPQGNATRAEVATIIMNFAKTYK